MMNCCLGRCAKKMTKVEPGPGLKIVRAVGRGFGAVGDAFYWVIALATRRGGGKAKRRLPSAPDLGGKAYSKLEYEIARLEDDLDQVYSQVVRGAGYVASESLDPDMLDLRGSLEQARGLKRDLRAKRAEISRLKREGARQHRLMRTVGIELPTAASRVVTADTQVGPPRDADSPIGPKVRRAILRAVKRAEFTDDSRRAVFDKYVHDLFEVDPEIRRTAAVRLGEFEGSVTVEILNAAIEDADERVRVAAINSLALVGDHATAVIFERFVDDPSHLIRLGALRGLARVVNQGVHSALIDGLEDDQTPVRRAAAGYLGWRKDKRATKSLIRALHDEDETVRGAAASSLGDICDDRAVLSLIRALKDESMTVREAAKMALEATIGEEVKVEILSQEESYDEQIEDFKRWWGENRVDKHIERTGGLTMDEPIKAPLPAPLPAAPAPQAQPTDAALEATPTGEEETTMDEEPAVLDDLAGLEGLANLGAAIPADFEGGLNDGGPGDLAGLGAAIPADFEGGLDDAGPGDLAGLGGVVSSDGVSGKDMGNLDIHVPENQNEKDKKETEITSKKENVSPDDKK